MRNESGEVGLAWVETADLDLRASKILHLLRWIGNQVDHVDVVLLPEYSFHCKQVLPKIREWSDEHRTLVITGGDVASTPEGRICNTCYVFIPGGEPIPIVKRQLSEFETSYLVPPLDPVVYRFVWTVQDQQYWLLVYVCLDFLDYALLDRVTHGMVGPGVYVVPMCSPVIAEFYPFASVLLRTEHGTATVMANTVGQGFAGCSSVFCAFPGGRATQPALPLPEAEESVACFDLDLTHLTLHRPTSLTDASPLRRVSIHRIGYTDGELHCVPVDVEDADAVVRGVLNPFLFELSGKKLRIAFLEATELTTIPDRVRGQSFETLAVLGRCDLIISHLHQDLGELILDLKTADIGMRGLTHVSGGTGDGVDHHDLALPFFEVTEFYKVLGVVCDAGTRRLPQPPAPEDLPVIAALGRNWYDPLVPEDFRARCLENRWILERTHRRPGRINALITVALEDRGPDLARTLREFESQVVPGLLSDENVTSLYRGTGFQLTADYLLRVNTGIEDLFGLLRQLHSEAARARQWVSTSTFVVLDAFSELRLDEVFRQIPLPAQQAEYSRRFFEPHLARDERLRFHALPEAQQLAVLEVFREVESAASSVAKLQNPGTGRKRKWDSRKVRESLAPNLLRFFYPVEREDRIEALRELRGVHDALQGRVEEILQGWVGGLSSDQYNAAKREGQVPSQKDKNQLSFREAIHLLLACTDEAIPKDKKDSVLPLQETVRLRNIFSHPSADAVDALTEFGIRKMGTVMKEYCQFLRVWW